MRRCVIGCLVLSAVGCATATSGDVDDGVDGTGGSAMSGGSGSVTSGGAASGSGGNSASGGGSASGGNTATGGDESGSGGSSATGGADPGTGGTATGGSNTGGDGSGGSGGSGGSEPTETCEDEIKNQSETDVDCGGAECEACEDDEACLIARDCVSGVCDASICQVPACTDGVKNGQEASLDCGGDCADCSFPLNRVVIGSTTTTATAVVTWDESGFHVFATVLDSTLRNDSDLDWQDDGIEIYLDLNNGKTGAFQADDFQVIASYADDTTTGMGAANFATILVIQGVTEGGYTLDVSIPWTSLNANPPPLGQEIGFSIAVNDDKDGGDRDAQLMLYGTDQSFNNPSLWGVLTLH